MQIAKELRKKSIAEYLLYMWQMEDLIRAMGCSLPLIRKAYISKFTNLDEEQLNDEIDWFGNMVRMMNEEGKRDEGHLSINEIVVHDMTDFHNRLLHSNRFPVYNAEYYKVLPFIVELRNKGEKDVSEIETCLNALYGVMVLHMQNKEISPETELAIKEITIFTGLLSDYYIKDEKEGLDWGDKEPKI